MYMIPTTTSSFRSNTANHCSPTTSRSPLCRLHRKSANALTSHLKRLAPMATTSIYSHHFHLNTEVQMWYAYSSPLLPENSFPDFLCSRKISGEESSGVTASTLPPSASGETGNRSNNTLPTKERRWRTSH